MTKLADVHELVRQTVETYGRLDVFVNNAGIYRGGKLTHEFPEEDLDACCGNVKAPSSAPKRPSSSSRPKATAATSTSFPHAGLGGQPNQSVYDTSKGAAANLTRCLAIEYGHERICVNGIFPCAKSALTRTLFDDKDFFTQSVRLRRWARLRTSRRHRRG